MATSLLTLLTTFLLLVFFSTLTTSNSTTTTTTTTTNTSTTYNLTSIHYSICNSTPHPSSCLRSVTNTTLLSIPLPPYSLLSFAIHSLHSALAAISNLTPLLSSTLGPQLTTSHRSAVEDCLELHAITLASLSRSASLLSRGSNIANELPTIRAYLSAALTNKATCLDGLSGAQGPLLGSFLSSFTSAYELVTNTLSLVAKLTSHQSSSTGGEHYKVPKWVPPHNRKLLQDDDNNNGGGGEQYDPESVITVAKDGTGNFTTIGEAVAFVPNNSDTRTIILVRAGTYEETVEVPFYKINIVLLGEGSDVTVITGSRSADDGRWTTFRSATVAISGQGFLARDITFRNTAGPWKGQAVALRVNADLAALYRCTIDGYQDTLYAHSFRQFYRECDIYGTIDFIFGNAAVVFQGCNIVSRKPVPGQDNVITAQGRDDPNEDTGISIQNCTIAASDELASSNSSTRTYLGRPWGLYSRTVVMESYIDGLVDRAGWVEWPGSDQGLDKLYYGEFANTGPGSGTDGRVAWPGYHVMEYDDAASFSVANFIYGDAWLSSTSFPYDDGI